MAFIPPGILIVLDNFVFIQIFTLFSQIDLDDWDGFKNRIRHIPPRQKTLNNVVGLSFFYLFIFC